MATRPCTSDQALLDAAAEANSLLALSSALGRSLSSGSRRQLRLRLEALGVDTRRLRDHIPVYARYTEDILIESAQASTSVMGVLRHLGLPLSGGNHSHISRRLQSLEVDTSHFTRTSTAGRVDGT